MTVSLLIPPGSEAHDYEPSSQDLEAIRNANFLYLPASKWIHGWEKIPLNFSEKIL
jgi:ABC-type Zn uptake system ZnuABC Zn-binding protein ZnuA